MSEFDNPSLLAVNGADDDLDDLVDFLDMGDDSDSDENELINSDKNTVECAAPDSDSDDDCGMNVAETETSNKCKNDKFNKKKQLADSSQLKHTKVKSEEEEIQSIKGKISGQVNFIHIISFPGSDGYLMSI